MYQYHLGYNDLLITPFFLLLVTFFINVIGRKLPRDEKSYFYWGLGIKIVSSILFGIVYAFIYEGGDTYQYWRAATIIGDAFYDSPLTWLKLVLHTEPDASTYLYVKKLMWYEDSASYVPCQVAGFLSPFCFNTYSIMSVCFSILSFVGLWKLFKILKQRYPDAARPIAISIFFSPSIFFWGSGLMKDTLTLGALSWMFSNFYTYYILRKKMMINLLAMLLGG